MRIVIIIAGIFFAIFVILFVLASLRTAGDRRTGILPPAGQGTMADVERLIQSNEIISAIRVYREIHRCGLAEAKQAVEQIRDRIKPV
jgi:ribosomal protein L7/L12